MKKAARPSYLEFDRASYPWRPDVDYRLTAEAYRVGKGEQGVLICAPYKAELAPLWRFKTPEIARESSAALYAKFLGYLAADDFPGADLARKFLQMGYTRARRYANYRGGRKYDKAKDYAPLARGTGNPLKAEAAAVFHEKWREAEANPAYAARKKAWKEKYG